MDITQGVMGLWPTCCAPISCANRLLIKAAAPVGGCLLLTMALRCDAYQGARLRQGSCLIKRHAVAEHGGGGPRVRAGRTRGMLLRQLIMCAGYMQCEHICACCKGREAGIVVVIDKVTRPCCLVRPPIALQLE